jgi:fructosamine-3-kinase
MPGMWADLVKQLLLEKTGAEPLAVSVLTGGQVGRVYRADTAEGRYVVKFVGAAEEGAFSDEARDDRVYGSRWSNLLPAYRLLRESGIATPRLHAFGTLENGHYEILDYLEGDPDDFSAEWFAALGTSLGSIHRITRPYQGWVGMGEPHAESWVEAFAGSLESRLSGAEPFLEKPLHEAAARLIGAAAKISEPEAFVLSHADGFQGVLTTAGGRWTLLGVVDIEDHLFCDPRFVLAGLELPHALEARTVPDEFWENYKVLAHLDPDAAGDKTIFQAYYLLTWIRVFRDQPVPRGKCISKLSELLR